MTMCAAVQRGQAAGWAADFSATNPDSRSTVSSRNGEIMVQSSSETAFRSEEPIRKSGPLRCTVSSKSDDHLYVQIERILKKEIADGVYPAGSRLPTEDELCERFSVSRFTVREALKRLRADNLVASRPRAGTTVVPRPAASSCSRDIVSINDLISWSSGQRFAIESLEMVVIDGALATRTGLLSGEEWLWARGFGYAEGLEHPACWAEYFVHREYAAVRRVLPQHTGPLFPLIENLFGHKIVEVHQEIGATLISSAIARPLRVQAGTAGLEVRRTYKTSNGLTAQVTLSTHPSYRYRYSTTLRRAVG